MQTQITKAIDPPDLSLKEVISIAPRISDMLDALQTWTLGHVLERGPDENLERSDMEKRVIEHARIDEAFRNVLLAEPYMVWMLAVNEALGISKLSFIKNIAEVHNVEETERCLSLVLPACHNGCTSSGAKPPPPGRATDSCHVCGRHIPRLNIDSQADEPEVTVAMDTWTRPEIEREMILRTARDETFKRGLLSEPTRTYRAFCQEICGDEPEYLRQVQEIRVMDEDDTVLYFSVPADLASNRADSGHVRNAAAAG